MDLALKQPSHNYTNAIETWYIAGNTLDAECMSIICDALAYDRTVTELWLKRNPIKPNGSIHIQHLLTLNNTIVTLDLHNTGLLDEGFARVCEGLKANYTLQNLYVEANGISDVSPIVTYFEQRGKLKQSIGVTDHGTDKVSISSLWIGMNPINDTGAILLCQC